MIRTNVSFQDDQYNWIKEESYRRGVSFSEFIRKAVDNSLSSKETKVTKPVSVNPTGSSEVSLKKNVVKKPILQGKFGNCKICGAGLNEYGDFCIGKVKHKQ